MLPLRIFLRVVTYLAFSRSGLSASVRVFGQRRAVFRKTSLRRPSEASGLSPHTPEGLLRRARRTQNSWFLDQDRLEQLARTASGFWPNQFLVAILFSLLLRVSGSGVLVRCCQIVCR